MSDKEINIDDEAEPFSAPKGLKAKIVGGIVLVFLIWFLSAAAIWTFFGKLELANQYGGIFGAVGALFSGLALGGVIVAIHLQKQELALQRLELRLTRRELERTAAAQEQSEKALREQATALSRSVKLAALQYVPLFEIRLTLDESLKSHIEISNIGTTPAFDLAMHVLPIYSKKDKPIEDFIASNAGVPSERLTAYLKAANISTQKQFGVSETLSFFSLPSGNKLNAELIVPAKIESLLILFQYRDVQGSNYCQLHTYLLDRSSESESASPEYFLSELTPITPEPFPRFIEEYPDGYSYTGEDEDNLGEPLIPEDGSAVPDYYSEFVELWRTSIPSQLVRVWYLIPKPRVKRS